MTQPEKDLAYEILDVMIEAITAKPPSVDFPVRIDNSPRPKGMSLSSAGKGAKYLAHMHIGSKEKEGQPRYLLNMDMGSLAHDYIRWILNEYQHCELTDAERTVSLTVKGAEGSAPHTASGGQDIEPAICVKGHIDGFLTFETARLSRNKKVRILLDIKCVDMYTFNELDPRNPETNWWARSRKWNAGNYVFDANEAFENDDFKRAYLGQVAGYEKSLDEEGEEWDATAFILYNRNTSHFAVGIYDSSKTDGLVAGFTQKATQVHANPDPTLYEPCYPAEVGASPGIVCQYCDYLHECFDVKTKIFRGKPRFNILRIR